jgi:glycogen operon protein
MLSMGDEVRLTRYGNNNAYCQDNETSWFDWSLLTRHADIHRFTKGLIGLRVSRRYKRAERLMTLNEQLHQARMSWHGVKLGEPDWADHSHSLAVALEVDEGLLFHIMISSYREPLEFELPPAGAARGPWRRLIDTSLESPDDFCAWDLAPRIGGETYRLKPWSIAVLFSHAREEG